MARAEALEAPLDLALQMPSREAVVVRAISDRIERLARQQHLVAHRRALAGEPAADGGLAAAAAVGIRRVEDVDAEVERGVHDPAASSSFSPWPKNAGDDPMPPKLPQPRMMRETLTPVVPSGT